MWTKTILGHHMLFLADCSGPLSPVVTWARGRIIRKDEGTQEQYDTIRSVVELPSVEGV